MLLFRCRSRALGNVAFASLFQCRSPVPSNVAFSSPFRCQSPVPLPSVDPVPPLPGPTTIPPKSGSEGRKIYIYPDPAWVSTRKQRLFPFLCSFFALPKSSPRPFKMRAGKTRPKSTLKRKFSLFFQPHLHAQTSCIFHCIESAYRTKDDSGHLTSGATVT